MKALTLLFALSFSLAVRAQQDPHGTVYGSKPNAAGIVDASKVETFMGNKPRVSTTLKGKVLRITNSKGGWFELEGANGKVIQAHFKNTGVTLPANLAGHEVIAEGVVGKQIIPDDKQHYAGAQSSKTNGNGSLTLEVTGLEVDK